MAAACLGVAANETVVFAVQEYDVELEVVLGNELIERCQQRTNSEIAGAHIDAKG
jgi:hypothetical protein